MNHVKLWQRVEAMSEEQLKPLFEQSGCAYDKEEFLQDEFYDTLDANSLARLVAAGIITEDEKQQYLDSTKDAIQQLKAVEQEAAAALQKAAELADELGLQASVDRFFYYPTTAGRYTDAYGDDASGYWMSSSDQC